MQYLFLPQVLNQYSIVFSNVALDFLSSRNYFKHARCVQALWQLYAILCRDSSVHGMLVLWEVLKGPKWKLRKGCIHIYTFKTKGYNWGAARWRDLLRWDPESEISSLLSWDLVCHPPRTSVCAPVRKFLTSRGFFLLQFALCWYGWLNYWPHDWTQPTLSNSPSMATSRDHLPHSNLLSGAHSHPNAIKRCPRSTSLTKQTPSSFK